VILYSAKEKILCTIATDVLTIARKAGGINRRVGIIDILNALGIIVRKGAVAAADALVRRVAEPDGGKCVTCF
jgi:hypothetical protein